ncbi:MAG: neutral zinc metallopeptidase [Jatrophihabitantaceae bacterium]
MARRCVAALAVLSILTLSACTTAVDGAPRGRGAAPRPAALRCTQPETTAEIECLRTSLSRFWTDALGRRVDLRTVYAPRPDQVPRNCRSALRLNTAFSCPVDDTVYLTAGFVRTTRSAGAAAQAWIRLATTMGHEMGHIVQFVERAPLAVKSQNTPAESRQVEQQADCLAGVWSASVGIDTTQFLDANSLVLAVLDTRWERVTHGAPAERLAAVRRGQHGRAAASCGLTVRR